MKILYGTTNKAKIQVMKNAIESLDIELIGGRYDWKKSNGEN